MQNQPGAAVSHSAEEAKREPYFLLALSAMSLAVFFYGLGALPFLGPDEPRYAQIAREMFASGDWITPRLAGIHWFEKPALTYWLAAAGYALFGVSEFAARYGVALTACFGVLLLYWYGRRLHSARYGYLSAATLLTCGLWPGFAHGVTFDLPLAVCLEAALLSFFFWERGADRRAPANAHWWLFCLSLGLTTLAKGLVGLALAAIIIGAYLSLTRRWPVVWQARLLLPGALVVLAVAALWYAPMCWRHGREFVDDFFIAHHFQRYTSNKYKHPQPFYFFPLVALAGSFPWTPFLLANLWRALQDRQQIRRDEKLRLRLFLWLWVGAPLLFFSFSGSKLPGYILPVFPAVALLIGEELLAIWQRPTAKLAWPHVGVTLLCALAALLAYWLALRELGLSNRTAGMLAGALLLLAVGYLGLCLWRKTKLAIGLLPFGMALLVLLLVQLTFPALGRVESLAELSQQAGRLAAPHERLLFFVNSDHSIDFYAPHLPLRDGKSELVTAMSVAEVVKETQARQSLLVLAPQRWATELLNSRELSVELLGQSASQQACSPACDWFLLRTRP
jgi:4-amino-4-deoxy-L-arabinose transferase-like glycosyltransferase